MAQQSIAINFLYTLYSTCLYNVKWLLPSKCKHSRAELLKGISSPELLCSPTASEDLIETATSKHWNQALVSDRNKTARVPQKVKKIIPITGSESHKTRGKAVLTKGKAEGNQSLMRVIVQRRAFVLQTYHCESASHWSPGLKPNLFGIYGNKVSCWLSARFSFSVLLHSEENKMLHTVFFFYILFWSLKYVLKHIFLTFSAQTHNAHNAFLVLCLWCRSTHCNTINRDFLLKKQMFF